MKNRSRREEQNGSSCGEVKKWQVEVKSSYASGDGVVVGKTYCSLCTKEQIQNGPL